MTALLLLLSLSAGWEKVGDKDGVTIERRAKDNGLYEVRALAHAPLTPEKFFETLWKHGEYMQFVPHLKSLRLLVDEPDHKLIYEQIKMPVISDRDYTVRVSRVIDPATHLIEVHFDTANDQGPPPSKDYVRIPMVHGGWTLEPSEGGVDISYYVFTDPGGAIPNWIINSAQKDATRDFLLAMIARAKKNAGVN